MGTYRVEWPCCGSATETEAWEPEQCPFCEPDNAANAPADPALLALAKLGAMVLDWSPLECGFPTMPGSVIDAMAVRAGAALEDSGDGGHACWTAPGVKLAIARLLAPDGADGAGEVGPGASATMADRTLPLAVRVEAWYWPERTDRGASGYQDAVDALLADVAAADRLARAMRDYHDTLDAGRIGDMAAGGELVKMADAMFAALDDYRARMAQGVGDGE